VTELIAQRLTGEDGLVTFRTLVVACAVTAFLTAVGATALSYAFVATPKPITRVVAVRSVETVPAAAAVAPAPVPAAPAPGPAAQAAPVVQALAAEPANPWTVARSQAAAAASGDQLDPSPPDVLAGGTLVAPDLVAPCATLSLAGAVARGLARCP
jgi:hypothetical protein